MKLRSAAFLLTLSLVSWIPRAICSEPVEVPELSISQAATIAETELKTLKADQDHYIRSIFYFPGPHPRYGASIEPPLSASPTDPPDKKVGIFIYMDGRIETYAVTVNSVTINMRQAARP